MGKKSKWIDYNIAEDIINRLRVLKEKGAESGHQVSFEKVPEVKFDGNGFDGLRDILINNLKFDDNVPYDKKIYFLTYALFEAAKKNIFDQGAINEFIKKHETTFLLSKKKKYILLTSLSVKYGQYLSRIKVNDVTISFLKNRPKNFDIVKNVKDVLEKILNVETPSYYTYVKVSVPARCQEEAYEKAFANLDFIRGIWNFTLNLNKGLRTSTLKTNPVNNLVYGPVHTLHNEKGEMYPNCWGWQPEHSPDMQLADINSDYKIMKQNEESIRKELNRKNPYTAFLKRAIIRYVRALDDPLMTTAFIKLWSVLEYLTITGFSSYEITIDRASKIFKDKKYCKYILNALKRKRNNIIHNGDVFDTAEQDLYRLMTYVNLIFKYLLESTKIFKNTVE
ncbi:MAG: hypothetical protein KAI70_08120, partial [Candidatus Omnitrophica bacterium]|nr:hypothetical protein [Candidatus Omnitrophota bacterium]